MQFISIIFPNMSLLQKCPVLDAVSSSNGWPVIAHGCLVAADVTSRRLSRRSLRRRLAWLTPCDVTSAPTTQPQAIKSHPILLLSVTCPLIHICTVRERKFQTWAIEPFLSTKEKLIWMNTVHVFIFFKVSESRKLRIPLSLWHIEALPDLRHDGLLLCVKHNP